MIDYPEFNEEIGGWICSGCGVITAVNYDDKDSCKVAPICEECRQKWDKITKKELEVLKPAKPSKWLQFKTTFTTDTDLKKLLQDYRKSIGVDLVIDEKLQAIADEYVQGKIYTQKNEGQVWFNDLVTNGHFINSMALKWLRFDSITRFTDVTDLLKRDGTKEILLSEDLKAGVARDDVGYFVILSEAR